MGEGGKDDKGAGKGLQTAACCPKVRAAIAKSLNQEKASWGLVSSMGVPLNTFSF